MVNTSNPLSSPSFYQPHLNANMPNGMNAMGTNNQMIMAQ
jgi:hypothetical protein